MRVTTAFAAAFALAMPIAAQTVATERQVAKTDKLWRIEASGLTGWGAPGNAQRISSILKKEKGITNLIFDTCGVGYFAAGKGYTPNTDSLNEQLVKGHLPKEMRITTLAEVEVPKAEAVFELTIAGLGWAASSNETREVLSKLEGVGRVHPFGHNGKALVFVTDAKAFSADKAKEALAATKSLRLRHVEKASTAL